MNRYRKQKRATLVWILFSFQTLFLVFSIVAVGGYAYLSGRIEIRGATQIEAEQSLSKEKTLEEDTELFIQPNHLVDRISKEYPVAVHNQNKTFLNQNSWEEEITTYQLEQNPNFKSSNPLEREYLLTISNPQSIPYISIRATLCWKEESTLISIFPVNDIEIGEKNVIFTTPAWFPFSPDETITISIRFQTPNETFVPDIEIVGRKDDSFE